MRSIISLEDKCDTELDISKIHSWVSQNNQKERGFSLGNHDTKTQLHCNLFF